jgi:hypothetical protein
MKNWKDILSSVCSLMFLLGSAIVGMPTLYPAIIMPKWLSVTAVVMIVLSGVLVAWMQGKNPNLTSKTPEQIAKANSGVV